MPPLPRPDHFLVADLPDSPKSAYIRYILLAEENPTNVANSNGLLHVRILSAFLIYAPNRIACEWVALEITTAMRDHHAALDRLDQLGKLYLDRFIRLCEHSLSS